MDRPCVRGNHGQRPVTAADQDLVDHLGVRRPRRPPGHRGRWPGGTMTSPGWRPRLKS
ncbi:hypothetical protein IBTHAUMO2_810004 [Nitrosopumilaceae archaeon]|nr:hypothetical protein IBTHAUMO2_810004 [Nitrosopumilaceae archaeon]